MDIFKKEKNVLIAGALAAAGAFGTLLLVLKAKERRNTLVQALKDIKKELFPTLCEIAAASSDESTPSGEANPYRKAYMERIDAIFAFVLRKHDLDVESFKKVCTVDYKRHHCISERYDRIMKSIDHAFNKISPEISCKIPHHLTPEDALELQKNIQKSVLKRVYQEVNKFRSQGKAVSLESARFANIYYQTLWNYEYKRQCYANKDLDELEDSADQIRLHALEIFKKDDESFREELAEIDDQAQRAVQAMLLNDRDAVIFIEAVGSNLNNSLNKSVRSCA